MGRLNGVDIDAFLPARQTLVDHRFDDGRRVLVLIEFESGECLAFNEGAQQRQLFG